MHWYRSNAKDQKQPMALEDVAHKFQRGILEL